MAIYFLSWLSWLSNAQVQKYETKQSFNPTVLTVTFFNPIFLDTKGPINPGSDGNHFTDLFVDQFSNYIATVPAPKK